MTGPFWRLAATKEFSLYHDDMDRQDFLQRLAGTCQRTGFQVHACCLMRNPFHLARKPFRAGGGNARGESGGRNALARHLVRVIAEALKRQGGSEAQWRQRRKSDPIKLALAARLRRETLVTVAWMAKRLEIGSVAHVHTLRYHWRRKAKAM